MILFLIACATDPSDSPSDATSDLTHRAYVVSNESNEMFVFDYDTLEEIGSLDTTVTAGAMNGNHMAMVSMDGKKVYTTAAEQDSLVVIDAATLTVCRGDFNCDTAVDGDDVIAFFFAWDAGDIAGDVNNDQGVDGDDVVDFFAAWDTGC